MAKEAKLSRTEPPPSPTEPKNGPNRAKLSRPELKRGAVPKHLKTPSDRCHAVKYYLCVVVHASCLLKTGRECEQRRISLVIRTPPTRRRARRFFLLFPPAGAWARAPTHAARPPPNPPTRQPGDLRNVSTATDSAQLAISLFCNAFAGNCNSPPTRSPAAPTHRRQPTRQPAQPAVLADPHIRRRRPTDGSEGIDVLALTVEHIWPRPPKWRNKVQAGSALLPRRAMPALALVTLLLRDPGRVALELCLACTRARGWQYPHCSTSPAPTSMTPTDPPTRPTRRARRPAHPPTPTDRRIRPTDRPAEPVLNACVLSGTSGRQVGATIGRLSIDL